MKDRLVAGSIAGAIAGVIQTTFGLIVYALGFSDRSYIDYRQTIISFNQYETFLGQLTGFVSHIAASIIFGIVFAYLISSTSSTSSRYLYIKGVVYGIILWFLVSSVGSLFGLPLFKDIPPTAIFSDLVSGIIFGFMLALAIQIIVKRTKLL